MTTQMAEKYATSYQRQQGAALAISLILLIAMTIVGIATMSGSRLNERISSNAQQKSMSFEAAESSIAVVWNVPSLLAALGAIPVAQFNDPLPITPAVSANLAAKFDQSSAASATQSTVDVTAGVSIQYCGETQLPTGSSLSADESTLQLAGAVFDVNGTAVIAGSHAASDHLQRGYVIRPKTGRTGNCTTPGV
ncbi:MAG: hypothetical protein KTR32_14540 [Granulosicoccus sp.]|nr:hypothetical protein [Granulosicoccus sp.]